MYVFWLSDVGVIMKELKLRCLLFGWMCSLCIVFLIVFFFVLGVLVF